MEEGSILAYKAAIAYMLIHDIEISTHTTDSVSKVLGRCVAKLKREGYPITSRATTNGRHMLWEYTPDG